MIFRLQKYINLTQGLKRRFLLIGVINVFLTNLLLQLTLSINFISIYQATLFSQIFNGIFGYCAYSKIVFSSRSLTKKSQILKYLTLMTTLWFLNWVGINILKSFNIIKNLSAIIMIAPLALISFYFQKIFIFKK